MLHKTLAAFEDSIATLRRAIEVFGGIRLALWKASLRSLETEGLTGAASEGSLPPSGSWSRTHRVGCKRHQSGSRHSRTNPRTMRHRPHSRFRRRARGGHPRHHRPRPRRPHCESAPGWAIVRGASRCDQSRSPTGARTRMPTASWWQQDRYATPRRALVRIRPRQSGRRRTGRVVRRHRR